MRTGGMVIAITAILMASTAHLAHAQSDPPMTLTTDNNSMRVAVDWNPKEIEPDRNVDIMLEFMHPFADSELAHVNYDFEIFDENGDVVESMRDLHTHIGSDVQTVNFDSTGNFRMVVTVIGTGLTPPFDTTRSGTVEAAVVVVPEFPIAPAVLAAATGLAIAGARWRARNS